MGGGRHGRRVYSVALATDSAKDNVDRQRPRATMDGCARTRACDDAAGGESHRRYEIGMSEH